MIDALKALQSRLDDPYFTERSLELQGIKLVVDGVIQAVENKDYRLLNHTEEHVDYLKNQIIDNDFDMGPVYEEENWI